MMQFSLNLGTGVGEERIEVRPEALQLTSEAKQRYNAEKLTCGICAEAANHRGHPVRHSAHRSTEYAQRPAEWAKRNKRRREAATKRLNQQQGGPGRSPG